MKMKSALTLLLMLALVQLTAGCGGGERGNDNTTAITIVSPPPIGSSPVPTPTPPGACLPALSSAHGSVPFGDKACSPDKMLYAREDEPKDMGRIGIYERATDKLLQSVKVAQQPDGDAPNELKGLAWSPDSRLVAVMYHRSGGSTVFVIDAAKGIEMKRLDISSQPHTLEFEAPARLKAGDEALDLR